MHCMTAQVLVFLLGIVTVVSDAAYSEAFVSKLHKDRDGHGPPQRLLWGGTAVDLQ